jgi:DNA ligase-1
MDFSKIADYFDKIENASSRLDMTAIIAELIEKSSNKESSKIIYLSQGLLGPEYKKLELGLGEKLVEQSIAKVTGYSQKEVEEKFKELGDLGKTSEFYASKKMQKSLFSQSLSLEKVFSNFLKITLSEGHGSQELKIKLLAELLNSAGSIEARYIVRIVLGNLRLGIGDPSLMDALAINNLKEFRKKNKTLETEIKKKFKKEEDIERQLKMRLRVQIEEKYNISPDLGTITELLKKNGLKELQKIKMKPGIPIRPTLAERLPNAEEIIKKIGKCAVEAKYDGFRIQVHKNNSDITIYSRKQDNMTRMFPEIVEGVKKQIKAKQAILEGEALAVNEQTGEYFPFQITIQRKRKYGIEEKSKQFPLKLFIFDIMFLEGKDLLEKPFSERRKILEKVIQKGKIIDPTQSIITNNPKEMNNFFDLCIEKGLEGIIAKDLNAKYIAGARKFAWIKLKRSYKGELNDTVDVVLIGYYEGKGQRQKFGLGTLLGAVYNKQKDSFESIAKIGTGLTEKKLGEYEKMLSKISQKTIPKRVVSGLIPDHWVYPKYVVEVLADEITKSPLHSAGKEKNKDGFALRFPRLIKDRPDKKPEESTSVEEIIEMFKKQKHVKLEENP